MVRRNERRSGASPPELRKPGECLKLNFNNDASQSKLMARKDSEKDSDRPHYYSQFWLDVAAGRRVIGAPKTNEETDMEPDTESVILRKPGRNSDTAFSDGLEEIISHPEVEPEFEAEEYVEPELDELEPENGVDVEDAEIPNIIVDETEIPDVDLAPAEEEEEPFFDEEEEEGEEEEDDLGWGRGRKKPKPGRQVKQPKKPRREPRRGY